MFVNYYTILGIQIDATMDEVRSAHRELARRFHPDLNPNNPDAAEQFIKIQKAFDVLSDPFSRREYDATVPASFSMAPLQILQLYSRAHLRPAKEPQLIYSLLRISPQVGEMVNPNPPLNICLVLDCSTSMQGPLLDAVKSTSIELVRLMRPQDIYSVVAFSDQAEVVVPATLNQDPQKLINSIRMLQTHGGTEIYKGLEAGYKEVQRNRNPKYVNHIILVTDGRTYGDEAPALRLAEQAGLQQIGISGLGIGGKWNDVFLDELAVKSGGSTMFVHKAKEVENFLREKITSLTMGYAEQLRWEFEPGPGVELRYAFRLNPDVGPLDIKSPMLLGSLPRSVNLEVILDMIVSPFDASTSEVNLLFGRLHYTMPSRPDSKLSVRIDLKRSVNTETDPLAPPQAIVQAMSTLTLYRIQERARVEVGKGNVRQATHMLQNVATHLFSQGQGELAQTVLREAAHLQQNMQYSEIGEKRIKYGTRALLLPSSTKE